VTDYFDQASALLAANPDWIDENVDKVVVRMNALGGEPEHFWQAIVEVFEQHNHPTESEKPVAQQAIAYEQCNGNAGVSPQRDMRRMNQTFEAWKQTMKSTDTDPDEVHFVKIVSQEMDGDAVSTKFDTYESDCVHTRP